MSYKIYRSPEGRVYRVKAGSKDQKVGVGPFEAIRGMFGDVSPMSGYSTDSPAEWYNKKAGKWVGGETLSEEGAKRMGYTPVSEYNYPIAIPPMAPPQMGYSPVPRTQQAQVENDPLVAATRPTDMSRFSAPAEMVQPVAMSGGVVVPPPRPAPPRSSTVKSRYNLPKRVDEIRSQFAEAMAPVRQAKQELQAADEQFRTYGGMDTSGRLYRSPTGDMPLDAATEARIAANAQPVSNGSVSSLYTTSPYRPSKSQSKPKGSWKDNYRSMEEFRQAEDAALAQQGKFRYMGPEVGGATVYMPSQYANNSAGYANYRRDQAAAQAQRQAAMAQNPAFQEPIFQNAGRPLYGADLAKAREAQAARYQARLRAGKSLYQQPVAPPSGMYL